MLIIEQLSSSDIITYMPTLIPGGLSAKKFLHSYWQKQPLLIRNAFPGFTGLLNKKQLIALACREDTQARLIRHQHRWTLAHGPFKQRELHKLTGHWTLLVENVNHFLPTATTLLKSFNFIPYARLDDVMVSFAPDGGGVGPHIDSYDVFLLQGSGKRLWQIAQQSNQTLIPNTPLRILKHFQPQQQWLLEPGDMLYLPPGYAHNGIAVGDCMTYSIGFRAPSYQEITQEFLLYLSEQLQLDGMYSDPDLTLPKYPAQISPNMIEQISTVLHNIRFNKTDVGDFLGHYLSEPKPHVVFDPPHSPLRKRSFIVCVQRSGIRLDLKSQLLFAAKTLFINGEKQVFPNGIPAILKNLANKRELAPTKLTGTTAELLYQWYLNGYLSLQ